MRMQWAAAALMALAAVNGVEAQTYPSRSVTVIVPFAPGGPADITGRIAADIFQRHLGQQFVVENVGGAGGTTGSPGGPAPRPGTAPPDTSPAPPGQQFGGKNGGRRGGPPGPPAGRPPPPRWYD